MTETRSSIAALRIPAQSRKMFGGLAFMVNGHMCCGIVGRDFVVRTGPDEYKAALSQPHARPMDFTGRPMRGLVYVAAPGYRSTRNLNAWVRRGLQFVQSLQPK
jgi:TfoX/Sxy family transcriptional regulator of competence genes